MKIAFICGALEPGHDGVGDYTRRLAGEIIKNGHTVMAIALHDRYVNVVTEEQQETDCVNLKVLRIPSAVNYKDKLGHIAGALNAFNAEWLSLQFVPYSFNDKGLPFSLINLLKQLRKHHKVQIMFHELWLGLYGKISFKQRVIARLQRWIIISMIDALQPEKVSTSIRIYKDALSRYQVELLPLFSNIPVADVPEPLTEGADSKMFVAVHFGTFTSYLGDFRRQLDYLNTIACAKGKRLKLVVFGTGGRFKSEALQIAREVINAGQVIDLNRLDESAVSMQLLKADVGISRADINLYGKSGTTIAMFEHGLPVLLRGVNPLEKTGDEVFSSRIFFADDGAEKIPAKANPENVLKIVAAKMIDSLH